MTMLARILLALLLALPCAAQAQDNHGLPGGTPGTQPWWVAIPTAPPGTNTNQAASTAFVTGAVGTAIAPLRTILKAPTTYYANPAGSNSNPCTLAAQCQTAQHLVDLVLTTVDTGGQAVTLQLTGTFPAGVVCSGVFTGGGTVTLMGDSVTPTNVVLNNGATGVGVLVQNGCSLNISYMRIKAATDIIQTMSTGKAFICGVDFTATGNVHMNAVQGSFMQKNCAVTISGGAVAHEQVTNNSVIRDVGNTTTFTASVAFSTGFLSGSTNGSMQLNGNTYSLGAFTVTGPKYNAVSGSALNTVGACASLPGSLAGVIGTQGQCL